MVFKKEHSLFLSTLFCIGVFNACTQTRVYAIPVNLVPSPGEGIKYPIHIACECDYSLYVDGKYIDQANKEVNIIESVEYGHPGWNATKKFYPIIYDESPKIIAFTGVGNQFPGFLNGFVMDMNNGEDYTKYQQWKCKDFSSTVTKVPPSNWITYDYDDNDWAMSASYGKNYQNNSFQLFEKERDGISLEAEWLWASNNAVSNIYCRKKNENVKTIPVVLTTVPVQTSVPTTVSKTIHPTPVQTSAPTRVQTHAPTHVSKTIHPTVVQTSAPTTVSKTIHTTVAQTSAPHPVQTSAPTRVSTTIHPTTVPAPPTNYNIVISPRIKIIIQNVKYSRKRSYEHIDNLFRKLKNYNDDYTIYKQLLLTRYHIRKHYTTILHDIRKLLYSTNTHHNHDNTAQTPHFVMSMQKLDNSIKRIEQSIKFIKGNHKYILLNIIHKLKLQYQTDTQRLLHKWNNDFN